MSKSAFKVLVASLGLFCLASLCSSCSQNKTSVTQEQNESNHEHESLIDWRDWSDEVFKEAKEQNKFVILDLEAIWCHWCHVMDEKTYSNPEVAEIINSKYIGIKVDQDSRPDLSNAYQDYGWPATIIFAPDGTEIVKRAGYIEATKMTKLLQAVVDDPNPELYNKQEKFDYSENAFLSDEVRERLEAKFDSSYDPKKGSLKRVLKLIDADSVEYALYLANNGDRKAENRANKTLKAAEALFDPAWGGVYQYSTRGDWKNPHYEKLTTIQARYLRIYSQAYLSLGKEKYKDLAKDVYRYIRDFLESPEGAFYTSQDADLVKGEHSDEYFALGDKARRKQGIPAVDKNIYSYQNGLIIDALATLYSATLDTKYLEEAVRAADWIIANRSLAGGGFTHGADDEAKGLGPFLNDNLYMAKAMLNLYLVTADREWLDQAEQTASFIRNNFQDSSPGFLTISKNNLPKSISKPKPLISENIDAVRFMNLIHHYSGKEEFKESAEYGMKYLASPDLSRDLLTEPGILLADIEISRDPSHVTVIGSKKLESARDLFLKAISYPSIYKRVEWWDRSEGPLPNPDVQYPELPKAAAFGCANNTCSLPVYDPKEIFNMLDRMIAG